MTSVTCLACGGERTPSDDELRARTVEPCACGNGSYRGINWSTFRPPEPPAPPAPVPEEAPQ